MATIAIFDSGVGGLSIYQAVQQELPQHRYLFVSDNLAYPYGTKTEQALHARVLPLTHRVLQQFAPDILIIACNTASTVLLPDLRKAYELPIVGVVPAIKPAAKLTESKLIGLLATPATIERAYTNKLIDDFAEDCRVIRVGSSLLVDVAERKLRGESIDSSMIKAELEPIIAEPTCDVLVLACTHFPLLYKEIEAVFKQRNHSIRLLDSGASIARRVTELVKNLSASNVSDPNIAVFTRALEHDSLLAERLQQLGFNELTVLDE